MRVQDSFDKGFLFTPIPETLMPPFIPEVLLPTQIARPRPRSGEEHLLLAILEDALEEYRKSCTARDSYRPCPHCAAREWFFTDDTGAAVTFPYACEALGFDCSAIRSRLKEDSDAYPRMDLARRHERGALRHRVGRLPDRGV